MWDVFVCLLSAWLLLDLIEPVSVVYETALVHRHLLVYVLPTHFGFLCSCASFDIGLRTRENFLEEEASFFYVVILLFRVTRRDVWKSFIWWYSTAQV